MHRQMHQRDLSGPPSPSSPAAMIRGASITSAIPGSGPNSAGGGEFGSTTSPSLAQEDSTMRPALGLQGCREYQPGEEARIVTRPLL